MKRSKFVRAGPCGSPDPIVLTKILQDPQQPYLAHVAKTAQPNKLDLNAMKVPTRFGY